jgi:hypothetical protein
MRKEITRQALVFVIASLGGFFFGRTVPVHHYEPWGSSKLLYDTTTGKICDPLKPFQQKATENSNPNPVDKALSDLLTRGNPNAYIPPCD